MRKTRLLPASLGLFLLGLSACDDGGTVTSPTDGWDTTFAIAYRRIDDTLILLKSTGQVRTYSYCTQDYSVSPSVPKLALDTMKDDEDDTLPLHPSSKTLLLGGHSDYVGNTAKQYLTRIVYDRVGAGSGLEGTWDLAFRDSITALNFPENDTALLRLRSESLRWSSLQKATGAATQLQFSNGSLTVRSKRGSLALMEIYYWERWDGTAYDITAKATSSNTVTYTGNETGEVVTVTLSANGDRSYSSTDPKRTRYTRKENPTDVSQCTQDSWFYTFKSENLKFVPASRAIGNGTLDVRRPRILLPW